ncbi:hypothetical protein HCN44_004328 [Aphidius gifuensis]|uniref:Uncharacterized protein n=1 Tax=Aphidius gifuensis TaxID=684658 RepID=A0A834XXV6_APHGI|nr:hypothetical protein HCN44_004328 [Aphidius gifuensis]
MRFYLRRILLILSILIFLIIGTKLLADKNLLINIDHDVLSSVINKYQDVNIIAPAYAPGIYMSGIYPKNTTSCSWNWGLPEILTYSSSKLMKSPEIGDKSPYKILPFIIKGKMTNNDDKKLPELTLCTHATADQVYNIVEIVKRWEGPISLAIFTPGIDAGIAVDLLERACHCEPQMFKVSVHLIFPAGRPPALSSNYYSKSDCAASDIQQRSTERKLNNIIYPINVARNIARQQSQTSRVLVSDIELLPSDKLASGFLNMIHNKPIKFGLIFVVAVFEIESTELIPNNKTVYFHKYVCLHCQKFPGLTRWILRNDPGKVRPLIVTKREFPHHRWEPIFIGTKDDPFYNENMSWEGRQDKMAQMLEMCLMNYRLIILDGAFLVHSPGIKRKSIKSSLHDSTYNFIRTQEKYNSRIYQILTRKLLKKYPANRRCRQ